MLGLKLNHVSKRGHWMAASQCHSPHWYICGGAPCLDDLNHEILLVIRGRYSGTIPRMGSANERRCYIATPSLIGWTYTQNYPWILIGLRTELNNSQPTILSIAKALHINAQTMCKSWWPMHMLMTNEFPKYHSSITGSKRHAWIFNNHHGPFANVPG